MSARCSLVVNGRAVRVSTGDTPLETALADGVIAATQALHGAQVLGQGAPAAVRRTRPRRLRVEPVVAPNAEPMPGVADRAPLPAVGRRGTLTEIREIAPHVVEVVATLTRALAFEPGRQVEIGLGRQASRALSPTLRVDGSAELNELVFHVPREEDPPEEAYALGAAVTVRGPVGRAYYRPGGGRLVLVGSGTGFAPIWSIARASRYIEPGRDLCLLVGAAEARDLYMRESLEWLRATGAGRTVLVAERGRQRPPDVRSGPLTAHLPTLRATDVVHVAGDASTVGAVQVLAAAVGARCYPILIEHC